MNGKRSLVLPVQRRRLATDAFGRLHWQADVTTAVVPASRAAVVLCDVWDRHWCRGANERLRLLLPRMQRVVETLREAAVLVVHAPSDTMPFYAGTPARQRVLDAPPVPAPAPLDHADAPLPFDTPNGGCDTPPDTERRVWTRQHPALTIDQERDAIADNGAEIYSLYRRRGITTVLILGVHANMCILNRSFAIRALVRWGFDVVLVRDLTDAMYNPADPPYVNHAEGTRLVVEYIEKFWCPTVTSDDVLRAAGG
jgi:nicotinamidase-related amidase